MQIISQYLLEKNTLRKFNIYEKFLPMSLYSEEM